MNSPPTVARNVHYYGGGTNQDDPMIGPIAALITATHETEGVVDLVVFIPGALGHPKNLVPYSTEPSKHCWCWPPKV